MRLLLHPGKHVVWPKPSGRGQAVNRCGEGEKQRKWVTEGGTGASLEPADATLRTVKATHSEAVQPGPGHGQRSLRQEDIIDKLRGIPPQPLSSTQTTKAVENKTGLRDCHSQRRRRGVPIKCHTIS